MLIKLYKSTILPVIEYGSVLYDNMSLNLSSKVENIHRRAAIICTGTVPRTETHKLLFDIGWTTLKNRRSKSKLVSFYKIYVNTSPLYLNSDLHAIIPTRSTRETRNSQTGKLGLPFCRTTKFKNLFLPSSLNLWNNLKIDIRQMDSLNKFKKFLNSKFEVDD